jgi:hypothetical protein
MCGGERFLRPFRAGFDGFADPMAEAMGWVASPFQGRLQGGFSDPMAEAARLEYKIPSGPLERRTGTLAERTPSFIVEKAPIIC